MAADDITTTTVRHFTVYSLRIFPLWEGEPERIVLEGPLEELVARISREKSVAGLIGSELKPMRLCLLEGQEAVTLLPTGRTYFEPDYTPVWKVMVPASGIYPRETIRSCITRNSGRNTEKYENVLFNHPAAEYFYNFSPSEIRPVDETIFVIEHQPRQGSH